MTKIEKGFYYHYKHNDSSVDNYSYEVMGTAWSTESAILYSEEAIDFIKDEVVVYRPLYQDSIVYKNDRDFWIRPLKMFTEDVDIEGKILPRFKKVGDPKIIAELTKIRDKMY